MLSDRIFMEHVDKKKNDMADFVITATQIHQRCPLPAVKRQKKHLRNSPNVIKYIGWFFFYIISNKPSGYS